MVLGTLLFKFVYLCLLPLTHFEVICLHITHLNFDSLVYPINYTTSNSIQTSRTTYFTSLHTNKLISLTMEASPNGIYKYKPNQPICIVAACLFGTSAAYHTYKMIRTRTWYHISLVIGSWSMCFPLLFPFHPIHSQISSVFI